MLKKEFLSEMTTLADALKITPPSWMLTLNRVKNFAVDVFVSGHEDFRVELLRTEIKNRSNSPYRFSWEIKETQYK